MHRHTLKLFVFLISLAIQTPARSEIPPENRDEADFVVTGVVRGVYIRDHGHYHNYIVELLLDEVEKGKDLERRDTFYVYCFKRKSTAPQEPSAGGHRAIPKEDQRIKAYVKDDRGKHNAIYPNWFDEAKPVRKE